MGDLVDHLSKQFKSHELIRIAEASGLSPTSRWGSRKLVDAILAHIKKNGVPKPPTDQATSDLLDDFLFVAEIIDAKGNVIPKKGGNGQSLEQYLEAKNTKTPDCFGFADDSAPECERCGLYHWCAEDRVANLPPCFGLKYEGQDAECKCCLEAPFCKEKLQAKPA